MTTLSCREAEELLDAFVDAELPAPTLLAVARHAGACAGCDEALRQRTALHEAIEGTVVADADGLDLSRVWPGIADTMTREDGRRRFARRLRAAPVWGAAGLALAASAVLFLRAPQLDQTPVASHPEAMRVSAVARPNRAVIDRLRTDGAHVALRSDRLKGTMLIMVNDTVEAVR